MKFATVAATLALSSSLATVAWADERQVIVLNLRGNPSLQAWPEGTRAVIAELSTSEDQVLVRPSNAATLASLMTELEKAAGEEQTVGAVCIGKSGTAGIAYVWVGGGSSAIRVEDDTREGAVAEGAVALRVTEILHARNLELPSARRPEPTPERAPPPPPPPAPPKGPPAFLTWLGIGGLTTSDAASPVPVVSAGARVRFPPAFAIEGAATSAFGWLRVRTEPGAADVNMESLTLHAVIDPWAESDASVSLGLGGGLAYAAVVAQPNQGYTSSYESTMVGLLSARIGTAIRGGNLAFVAYAEPGILVPPVTLTADG
ncbi:MAG TPA: hypothetical protein VF103_13400, partial [Polyangiaceae bacterium]